MILNLKDDPVQNSICSPAWHQQPQRPLCVRFSSTTIDEDKAGRSTSAACADIGACVVEEHRMVVRAPRVNVELSGDVIRTTC